MKKIPVYSFFLFLTAMLLFPLSALAQTAETSPESGSEVTAEDTVITELWLSLLESGLSLEYTLAAEDTAAYSDIVSLVELHSLSDMSNIGIFEKDGQKDYCTLSLFWEGEGCTEGSFPDTLTLPADVVYPCTLTYVGRPLAPKGYVFSSDIMEENRQITLTVHVYESAESLPKTPLLLPQDLLFYLTTGMSFDQGVSLSEIETALGDFSNVRLYFLTEAGEEVSPSQIQWDVSGIVSDTPGRYTAKGTFLLPQQYVLPDTVVQPLSMPIRIRDSSRLEISLNSVFSSAYSGDIYLPQDVHGEEGFLPAWYAYCGEEKPGGEQLTSVSFSQDDPVRDTTPFFSAYCYGGSSSLEDGSLSIDFSEMPDTTQEGWYAFYVEAGEHTSNYILIDSRQPLTAIDNWEGTRDGDQTSTLPEVSQKPPSSESSGTDSPSASAGENADAAPIPPAPAAPAQPTASPEPDIQANLRTTIQPDIPVVSREIERTTDRLEDEASAIFTEEDTETGVTLSGIRILALIEDNQPLVISKKGITVHLASSALLALELKDTDFLSITLTWAADNIFRLHASINGIALENLPETTVQLQEFSYRLASSWNILHQSGESWLCYESGGHPAFVTTMPGEYELVLPAESISLETVLGGAPARESGSFNPYFLWLLVITPAVFSLLLLYFRQRRRDKE